MQGVTTGALGKIRGSVDIVTTQGKLARWYQLLPVIEAMEPKLKELSDGQIRKEGLSLRHRARSGEPLGRILPEAFALVREAGRRTLGMRHYDVQLLGGIAIFHRSIVEMQTGEGKTLTATAPMFLYALAGRGALLATVNDYLAKRDADLMRPVYQAVGMNIGVIQSQMQTPERAKAYACDITYGTANEFGFDFLRDRLLLRKIKEGQNDLIGAMLNQGVGRGGGDKPVQRDPFFALVDEADSILIDEARTPLIISAIPGEAEKIQVATYCWCAEHAGDFIEDEDYEWDEDKKSVELTRKGRSKVRNIEKPPILDSVGMFDLYTFSERAIKVQREFHLERQYVVRDGEIVIVDEFTGRLSEGRKWRDGIHQAIEAKEGLEVTVATGQAARITIQDFFLRFENVAGMTGTAAASRKELKKIYQCNFVPIPTNRPPRRIQLPTEVYGNSDAKYRAIVNEIADLNSVGRPVLIGTRSIDKSLILARLLDEKNIEYQILNAYHVEEEAEIVAKAGQLGKVTVSTNMAGRGTDIRLGEGVEELGGLHVICTEMHESARIDRQLIGRCGRQGDPGSYRQYLSLDDELLLTGFGPKRAKRLKNKGEETEKRFDSTERLFVKAQKKVEKKHFRQRKALMYFEKQRKKMQREMGQDPYLDSTN
ncbi:MAG: preprotein translocase subunit SecA [Thermoguttaceae bacterium]|nr:preprotein translocase subunit SecA [Thermoguttaceae bacterium]